MLTELNVPISELQSHMVPSQWSMMKRGRVISFLGNVYIYYIYTYIFDCYVACTEYFAYVGINPLNVKHL